MPKPIRKPFYYRTELIAFAMRQADWDESQAAEAAGITPFSVKGALAGQLKTVTRLRALADVLGITWKYLFDIDLPESQFRRAVTNGSGTVSGGRGRS